MSLIDVRGGTLLRRTVTGTTAALAVGSLAPGLYTVVITAADGRRVRLPWVKA